MWFAFLDVPRDQTKMWCEKKTYTIVPLFFKGSVAGSFQAVEKKDGTLSTYSEHKHGTNFNWQSLTA